MTILTREGIDGIANHHRHDVDLGRWDADELDLIDTARAYHDLRDAVLALCDEPEPSKADWREFIYDGRPGVITDEQHAEYNRAWLRERIQTIRARVERGTP